MRFGWVVAHSINAHAHPTVTNQPPSAIDHRPSTITPLFRPPIVAYCVFVCRFVCLFVVFVCLSVCLVVGWLVGQVDWLVGQFGRSVGWSGRSVGRSVGWLRDTFSSPLVSVAAFVHSLPPTHPPTHPVRDSVSQSVSQSGTQSVSQHRVGE